MLIFQDNVGWTPLMLSCRFGEKNIEIIKLLIKYGADVNLQKVDGETALIYAARNDYTKIVELLLYANANIHIKDDSDNTAITYAHRRNEGMADLLLEFQVQPKWTKKCYWKIAEVFEEYKNKISVQNRGFKIALVSFSVSIGFCGALSLAFYKIYQSKK